MRRGTEKDLLKDNRGDRSSCEKLPKHFKPRIGIGRNNRDIDAIHLSRQFRQKGDFMRRSGGWHIGIPLPCHREGILARINDPNAQRGADCF
jgi:hypothetical protein